MLGAALHLIHDRRLIDPRAPVTNTRPSHDTDEVFVPSIQAFQQTSRATDCWMIPSRERRLDDEAVRTEEIPQT